MLKNLGLKNIVISSKEILNRFPLPIFCAFLAFILLLLRDHFFIGPTNEIMASKLTRIAMESIAGIAMFFTFHVLCENKNLDNAKKLGFILLGMCILGVHYYSIPPDFYNFQNNYTLRYFSLLLCLHLAVSFSLYYSANEIEAFWQYNLYLFIKILLSVSFSIILCLGIGGAMFAIEKLFRFNFAEARYIEMVLGVFLIFNTINFLLNVPRDTHVFEQPKQYNNGLRIFIQYILLPIVSLYAIILAVYICTILYTFKLPNGFVATPILVFSLLGTLAYLLAYPIRESNYYWIKKFCDTFFLAQLPFLILLFVAIFKRISDYGLSENRYFALALGVWILIISAYIFFSKREHLLVFPLSLCIILVLSSFGNWGMYKLSAKSQYARFINILDKNNFLKNKKLDTKHHKKLDDNNKREVNAIINYLYTHSELSRLNNILNTKEQQKLSAIISEGFDEKNVGSLLHLGNNTGDTTTSGESIFTYTSTTPELSTAPISTGGFEKLIQFEAIDYGNNAMEIPIFEATKSYSILANNMLYIIINNDTIFKNNLDGFTSKLKQYNNLKYSDTTLINSFSNINIPFRQKYLNADSLKYQNKNGNIYFTNIRCISNTNKTTAIFATGYAIF
jgi:Domain of unknown function (DUF4153)